MSPQLETKPVEGVDVATPTPVPGQPTPTATATPVPGQPTLTPAKKPVLAFSLWMQESDGERLNELTGPITVILRYTDDDVRGVVALLPTCRGSGGR